MMMKARLRGNEFDLQNVGEFFPECPTQVMREGDDYYLYLTSAAIDLPEDGATFFEVAPRILTTVTSTGGPHWSTSCE